MSCYLTISAQLEPVNLPAAIKEAHAACNATTPRNRAGPAACGDSVARGVPLGPCERRAAARQRAPQAQRLLRRAVHNRRAPHTAPPTAPLASNNFRGVSESQSIYVLDSTNCLVCTG